MTTLTRCTTPVTNYPIKFLGATLLSVNAKMGWGIETGTLTVELIEDCEPTEGYDTFTETIKQYGPDNFLGNSLEIIGSAAYFSLPPASPGSPNRFRFGGIITNWSKKLGSDGLVFTVSISDPRQILDNTLVIVDSYSDLPFQHINYYNVYAAYEAGVNYGNCNVFGTANSTTRGMNYRNILKGLLALAGSEGDPNYRLKVFSPTTSSVGFNGLFRIDLGYTLSQNDIYNSDFVVSRTDGSQLPLGPDLYRITDKISLLELIQNICELTGRDFYTNLFWDNVTQQHVIKVSTVQLQQPGSSIAGIIAAFQGVATDLSYGKELRNEKTRRLIFGDQVHYLTTTTAFTPFFGEDDFGNPVYPIRNNNGDFSEPDGVTSSNCGFWIYIDITKVNSTLYTPIVSNGKSVNKVWISELDIRAALSSYDLWLARTFAKDTEYSKINDSLVKILQNAPIYKEYVKTDYMNALRKLLNTGPDGEFSRTRTPVQDILLNINKNTVDANKINAIDDLDKIHKFILNLGQTFYGKQFLTRLVNNICVTIDNEEGGGNGFGEKVYSEVPTNDGGWVDYGIRVLGLIDPELSIFRSDDDRIKPFALFSSSSETNITDPKIGAPPESRPADPPSDPSPPSE
jgi:hypothetical protein